MMAENSNKPQTGTGSLSGDLLVLFILIVGGTCGTVWFFTLDKAETTKMLRGGVALVWFISMQPGIFLSWSFFKKAINASEYNQPWKRLAIIGLLVGIIFGVVLPIALATWINGLI